MIATLVYLAAFGAISQAVMFPSAPVNILVSPTGSGVQINWDPVDNATKYTVSLSDGQESETTSTTAAFVGLTHLTSYSGEIKALGENGTTGETAEFDFTTMMGKVTGLSATNATLTTISVKWDALNGTVRYDVRVLSEEDEEIEADISVEGTSAVISSLDSFSFYKIFVRAVAATSDGEEAMIRARTDGSGVRMTGFWEGDRYLIGGEGMIYRPLVIPPGEYRLAIQFPCKVESAKFWNAQLDLGMSSNSRGYFELVQSIPWMRRKAEIGMIFTAGDNSTCNFVNVSIGVLHGKALIDARIQQEPEEVGNMTTIPIEIEQMQWADSRKQVESGGWLQFRLDKSFHGVRNGDVSNTTVEKPAEGSYVIALDTGVNCTGGITVAQTWGMTQKNTSTLENVSANMLYFTQSTGNLWYNVIPGLVYGFDPAVCADQRDMSVSVMVDGLLVSKINKLPLAKTLY